VSRTVRRLSCLLFAIALPPAVQAADIAATVAAAEQPVRVLRDTSFYLASRGVQLQAGDIVESGAGAIQLEARNSSTVALGPATRVYFKPGSNGFELVLLDGWIKVQAPAGTALKIGAGALQLSAVGGAVIVHASPAKTELFVETGEPSVAEIQGAKALRTTRIPREQYAVRSASQPLKLLPRPPKEFLGGMPATFQDTLVPVSLKGPTPAAKLERRAAFADVAPWLADEPALHQSIYRRFNPPKPPKAPSPAFSY
jgi:hypothetical protein